MKQSSRLLAAVLAVAAISTYAAADGLGVGSPAPPIKVAKWIKGKPIDLKNGKVHVVEFWATWCGPCKDSIPHLTELAKKYKGKVEFLGVSAFEEQNPTDNSFLPKVESYVKEMGASMDYVVAADGFDGTMGKTWMQAANQPGIPTAFVVDKDANIVWIGHPMDGLDEVLGKVVAGKYDVAAAKAEAEAKAAKAQQMQELIRPFEAAMQTGDNKGAVFALDEIIEKMPEMEEGLAVTKFTLMLKYDEAGAQAYGAKLADGLFAANGNMLNTIAWTIIDPEAPLKKPNLELALRVAEKAVKALKEQDAYSMDTLALAQFKLGKKKEAIATATKALALADKAKGFDPDVRKEIADRLAQFKKAG